MDLHVAVRDVVDLVGAGVLDDADNFRGVLDDVLDESAAGAGEVNLLVDAVRFGAVDQLVRLLDSDAEPALAVATVGAGIARQRGGADPRAASWACAVLGFAVRRVPEDVVRDLASEDPPADLVATRPQPTPVASRPVPDPAPTPVPTAVSPTPTLIAEEAGSRPRSRRRLAVLLGVAAVSVVVSGLVVFLAMDGRTPPGAAVDDGAGASNGVSGQGTAQCWNGEQAAVVTECSAPTDVAGLAWVFPASDYGTCEPGGPGQTTKVVHLSCPMALADGGDVELHYSQWRAHDWMVDFYEAVRVGKDLEVGRPDLVAFPVEGPNQLQKVVLFYRGADGPFSVTVYADSQADLYAAVGRLIIRPYDQLRGLGPGEDEVPASFAVTAPPVSG